MFDWDDLTLPVVAAPMAGGPSTPALVAAVGNAGGLGFVAAGYLTPDELAGQIAQVRGATRAPFGVNLFAPEDGTPTTDGVDDYSRRLEPLAERLGAAPLPVPSPNDDAWAAKVEVLVADPVPVVSFTFGLPDARTVERLHAAGTHLVAGVVDAASARRSEARGVDALCLQGHHAGGHRFTLTSVEEPPELSALDLFDEVAGTSLPRIVTGGFADAGHVAEALRRGARAVQVGTGYLLADEAGTSAVHRAALVDPSFDETVVTRAFTGRPARALRNRFVDEFGPHAPAAYPALNQVTGPIRKAAAASGDPQWVHLWAGTSWRRARPGSAADITRRLAGL